jgi:hypothetical protein
VKQQSGVALLARSLARAPSRGLAMGRGVWAHTWYGEGHSGGRCGVLLDVYVCVVEIVGGRFAGNGRVGRS